MGRQQFGDLLGDRMLPVPELGRQAASMTAVRTPSRASNLDPLEPQADEETPGSQLDLDAADLVFRPAEHFTVGVDRQGLSGFDDHPPAAVETQLGMRPWRP